MNLTIPNLLSILRMGLIPWFAISVIDGDATRALWIFAIAGVTDALDGFIARFWRQQSALGAYLDPLADKLLLMTAYVMLAIPNLRIGLVIPAWVTALVITRDVVIVVVALVMHLAVGISRFPPSPLSKSQYGGATAGDRRRPAVQPECRVRGHRRLPRACWSRRSRSGPASSTSTARTGWPRSATDLTSRA